ncbi:MAG: hypothetical protein JO227_21745 [Acetobacteraceae bacterium]|nr:hypothetical protein [Acetobacteraceae bacterium]
MTLAPASVTAPAINPQGGISGVTAVRGLYAACHLPEPTVLVARDVPLRTASLPCCAAIKSLRVNGRFFGLLILGMAACGLLGVQIMGVTSGFVAVFELPLIESDNTGETRSSVKSLAGKLAGLVLIGALVTGAVYAEGAELSHALDYGGATAGIFTGIALLAHALFPAWSRHQYIKLAARAGPPVSIWHYLVGVSSADPVLVPRLLEALADCGDRSSPRPANLSSDTARRSVRAAIETEMRRISRYYRPPEILLGHAAEAWNNPARHMAQLASARLDPGNQPRILQAGIPLNKWAEAVCTFHNLAIILPAGAPARPVPVSASATPQWRRSRRAPWWPTLQALDELSPGLEVAIDLVPIPWLADRVLARRIAAERDAIRRHAAMTAMGIARFLAALGIRPVHTDEFGELYQIGPPENPSMFVAVRDRVLGPEGRPLQHWISVPPHMATAREAVAWTFGMGETEYRPNQES